MNDRRTRIVCSIGCPAQPDLGGSCHLESAFDQAIRTALPVAIPIPRDLKASLLALKDCPAAMTPRPNCIEVDWPRLKDIFKLGNHS